MNYRERIAVGDLRVRIVEFEEANKSLEAERDALRLALKNIHRSAAEIHVFILNRNDLTDAGKMVLSNTIAKLQEIIKKALSAGDGKEVK